MLQHRRAFPQVGLRHISSCSAADIAPRPSMQLVIFGGGDDFEAGGTLANLEDWSFGEIGAAM